MAAGFVAVVIARFRQVFNGGTRGPRRAGYRLERARGGGFDHGRGRGRRGARASSAQTTEHPAQLQSDRGSPPHLLRQIQKPSPGRIAIGVCRADRSRCSTGWALGTARPDAASTVSKSRYADLPRAPGRSATVCVSWREARSASRRWERRASICSEMSDLRYAFSAELNALSGSGWSRKSSSSGSFVPVAGVACFGSAGVSVWADFCGFSRCRLGFE